MAAQTAKHTPGPWRIEPTSNGFLIIGPWVVATVGSMATAAGYPERERRSHVEQAQVDGRVIAAAPDMLRALELILPLAKGYAPEGQSEQAKATCRSWIEAAESAIAKATAQENHPRL